MSSVDNRIVRMQFDNGQFESKAGTTLSTLERLKQALNFSGASKGLEGISAAASNVDLSGLTNGVDEANNRFSILATAASVALGNIATKAIETGATVAKAFTVDPVLQGFEEYELKMNSIQTMLMSTGEPLDRVNEKLGELNTYADKTIYSFADMTQNIGKFTNAGVNLDDSVAAIQGVANVAALSGANANEASHAMYNFGQALSSGAVKLIDWKSIENANMATVEFKNELISTAVELGTLVESEGKYISTTTDLNGNVSDAFDAVSMFNDSLSSQWLTTDVLTKTLGRYADENTEIGKKAYQAASQVKTFSQLLDTTKEAIGTGWADAIEIVIGNFEEARDLWTSVSDVVSGVVDKQSKARTEMLRTWKDLGGRTDLIRGLSNVFTALGNIMEAIGKAWEKVFPPMTGEKLASITKGFADFTEKLKPSESLLNAITKVFTGLFSVLGLAAKAFKVLVAPVGLVVVAFGKMLSAVTKLVSPLGSFIGFINNSVLSTEHLSQVANLLKAALEALTIPLKKLGQLLEPVLGKAKELFAGFGEEASKMFSDVGKAVKDFNLEEAIGPIVAFGKKVAEALKPVGEAIETNFKAAVEKIDTEELRSALEKFRDKASEGLDLIKEKFEDFRKWLSSFKMESNFGDFADSFKEGLEKAGDVIKAGFDVVKNIFTSFAKEIGSYKFPGWDATFDDITKPIRSLGKTLQSALADIPSVLTAAGSLIERSLGNTGVAIVGGLGFILREIADLWESAGGSISGVIETLGEQIQRGLDFITKQTEMILAFLKTALNRISTLLSNEQFGQTVKSGAFGAIALGIKNVLDALSKFVTEGAKNWKNVAKVLDAVKGTLEAYQKSLKAEALLKIAIAIAILAASIGVLSQIPVDKLVNGGGAVVAAATLLLIAMAIFNKIGSGDTSFKNIAKLSLAMISLSISVGILAGAMKSLSSLPIEQLGVGLLGITVLMVELAAVSIIMSKNEGKFTKGAIAMIAFAVALKQMSEAVATLGAADVDTLINGVASIILLIAALTAFVRIGKVSELGVGSGLAVLGIAAALIIMCSAVEKLGSIDMNALIQGLEATAVLLTEIAIFAFVLSNTSGLLGSAAALVILGVALLEVVGIVAILGNMDMDTVGRGLSELAIALGILCLALIAMEGTLGGAVAILALAAALTVLTPIIIILGSIPWEVAAAGLITIAAALGILVVAAYVVSPVAPVLIALSVAILAVSAAVVITSVGLIAFGAALASIAGGIVAFAAVSSVAIDGFLAAVEHLIVGILHMVVNVASEIADAGASLILALLEAINKAIPGVEKTATLIIETFISVLIGATGQLAELGVQIINAILQAIAAHTYEMANAAIMIITEFINAVADNIVPVVQAGLNLAIQFINGVAVGLRDNIDPLMDALENIANAVVSAILSILQKLVEDIPVVGEKMSGALENAKEKLRSQLSPEQLEGIGRGATEGLNRGIDSGKTTITETAKQLGSNVLSGVKEGVGDLFPVGSEKGLDFASGLESMTGMAQSAGLSVGTGSVTGLESISQMFPTDGAAFGTNFSTSLADMTSMAESSGIQLGQGSLNGLESLTGQFNPVGNEDAMNFINGIMNQNGSAQNAGDTLASSALSGASGYTGSFEGLGADAGQGFSNGVLSKARTAADAAASMIGSALSAAAAALASHSPSRKFRELGIFADEGLILGFKDKESEVSEASGDMVKGSLYTVGNALADALEAIEDSGDYTPTITPVLDLSEISDGASQVNGMLDTSPNLKMAAEVSQVNPQETEVELLTTQLQSALNAQNGKIVDGLAGVRTDIANLAAAVVNLQIVMDTGTLVGELVNPMDVALGQRTIFAERGM